MTRVRMAQPADVDGMLDRDQRLIGVHYGWATRLGDGATATDHPALVAVDASTHNQRHAAG